MTTALQQEMYLKLFAGLKGFKYSNFDLNVRQHSEVQRTSSGNICTTVGL